VRSQERTFFFAPLFGPIFRAPLVWIYGRTVDLPLPWARSVINIS